MPYFEEHKVMVASRGENVFLSFKSPRRKSGSYCVILFCFVLFFAVQRLEPRGTDLHPGSLYFLF